MSRGFRLAAVERMRVRRLQDAGHALALARQALVEASARRDLLHEHLLGCMPPAASTPTHLDTAGQRRAQLRDRIATADTELGQLSAQARAARDGWLAARGDARAVEALHERYRIAVRTEQDRRDQRQSDDLAAVRHRRPVIGEALESSGYLGGGDAA
jgi:flagellar FliJ protein